MFLKSHLLLSTYEVFQPDYAALALTRELYLFHSSLFSSNLVPRQRMFLGQAIYVLGPLHLGFFISHFFRYFTPTLRREDLTTSESLVR